MNKERLIKNAIIGDGYLWKHPKAHRWNIKFSSTTPELLEFKRSFCPEIFPSGVKFLDTSKYKGRFANAKPMYRLDSIADDDVTLWQSRRDNIVDWLDIDDIALWYLDDGGFSNSCGRIRYYICIGAIANTPEKRQAFESKLRELFGEKYGNIQKNNSKATENNKTWYIPKPIAENIIIPRVKQYGVLTKKIPEHLR